jgi:hypothetical protein
MSNVSASFESEFEAVSGGTGVQIRLELVVNED